MTKQSFVSIIIIYSVKVKAGVLKYIEIYLFHNLHQCILVHNHKCSHLHDLCKIRRFHMDQDYSHQYL